MVPQILVQYVEAEPAGAGIVEQSNAEKQL